MRESFKTEYKASVKIDPTSEPYLPHNDRTDNKAKNIYKEMSHENEYHIFSDNSESVKDMHERLYQEAKDTYMAKSKRKDKFTDKKATLVEAVYELTPETTKEQVIKLTQEIAKLTGFTPLHIAIHKDEGHTTENNTFQKHYHAHAIFFTLDKESGKQLKRQKAALTKENLAKMQDLATEHLSTSNYQMIRGERRYEYNKNILQNGGNKEDCKKIVYEKSIKDYAKNQAMKLRENELNYREKVVQQQKEVNKNFINEISPTIEKMQKIDNIDEELAKKNQELLQKTKELEALKSINIDYKKLLEIEQENKEKARINNIQYEPKFERKIIATSPIRETETNYGIPKYSQDLKSEYTLKNTNTTLEVIETIESISRETIENPSTKEQLKPKIKKHKEKSKGWDI